MATIAKTNTDFTLQEFDHFMGELVLIAWKLASVWKHFAAYEREEDELITVEKEKPPIETLEYQYMAYSQDLYGEMDGLLVQTKSTLDYVAKLPAAIIGKDWPILSSFGNKGQRVLNAFRNNLPDRFKKHVELFEWLFDEHEPWLEMAIQARDRINHYMSGGLSIESSIVAKTTVDGEGRILVPMWTDDLSLRDYLRVVWTNLFMFVEQFTGRALSMRLREEFGFINIPRPIDSVLTPFQILPVEAVEPAFHVLSQIQKNKGG